MTDPQVPDDPVSICADLLRKGDPDRFLASMTGDLAARKRLFVLYAFNLEIARAPFMSQEPMVALIRLQFWRDLINAAVDGQEAPPHEVGTPLADLVIWGEVRAAPLLRMIEARERDVHGLRRDGAKDVLAYLRDSSGALMLAAGQVTGLADFTGIYDVDQALEDVGAAQGLANWFLAQPALAAAGRGHVAPSSEVIQTLADHGLNQLAQARTVLGKQDSAALRSAWRAGAILSRAKSNPDLVADGAVAGSEFARRGRLLWLSLTRNW